VLRGSKRLKTHYAIVFAIEGSLLPFFPVYLAHQQGLTSSQIGIVIAVGATATLLTPVVATALADSRVDQRVMMLGMLLVGGAWLLLLQPLTGFVIALVLYLLFRLAFEPVKSLQDGYFFVWQRRQVESGVAPSGFHTVRVWGTAGYILPSIVLFAFVTAGGTISVTLAIAATFCVFGAVSSWYLENIGLRARGVEGRPRQLGSRKSVALALRRLASPGMRTFLLAVVLLSVTFAAYGAFYPLYLTDVVGIDDRWVGLVSAIGVAIEIVYMVAFGVLRRRYGLRSVLLFGAAAQATRMLVLWAYPSLTAALATQLLHGAPVLASQVAAKIHLDDRSDDRYRNTMQGLYMMLGPGLGRILGSAAAGQVARAGLLAVFAVFGGVGWLAVALLLWSFRTEDVADRRTGPDPEDTGEVDGDAAA
jgi:MFS transporter, PPP family, 3-phenylpropionic acid transporter